MGASNKHKGQDNVNFQKLHFFNNFESAFSIGNTMLKGYKLKCLEMKILFGFSISSLFCSRHDVMTFTRSSAN